jgi:S1-C subfamily serine protease
MSSPATLEAGNMHRDVCLLKVDASPAFMADIGRASDLRLRDTVFAIGFGVGRPTISVGQVEALYQYDGGVVVRSSAAFPMGASGGALFDSNGRLVGILTFYRHGHEAHAYYALPIEWATQLAASAQSGLADAQANPFWLAADTQPGSCRPPDTKSTANGARCSKWPSAGSQPNRVIPKHSAP